MPKRKPSSSKGKSRQGLRKKTEVAHWLTKSIKSHSFIGVSLTGGKTEKTCVAVIEYYPRQNKIFLSHLEQKIENTEKKLADDNIVKMINLLNNNVEYVSFDAPLKLPKCMRCRLKCPGAESCSEPEIQWLRKHYKNKNESKRPKRIFTPYTERCVENFIADNLEEDFNPPHALGANKAPLSARAIFLARRIQHKCIEVYPKLSLWRVGRSLGIQKSYLRSHKHSVEGSEIREIIIKRLVEEDIAFLYEQDRRVMIENNHAFEAFLGALTGVLKFKSMVEKKPKDFPRSEAWVEIPKQKISWPKA